MVQKRDHFFGKEDRGTKKHTKIPKKMDLSLTNDLIQIVHNHGWRNVQILVQ